MSGVNTREPKQTKRSGLCLFGVLITAFLGSAAASAQPFFSKSFSPDTIGPGSTSTLTFDIDNTNEGPTDPASDLAFTDTLPGGVTIAGAPGVVSTCGGGGIVSAPAGGGTITFSGGTVGADSTCFIQVNVTSSTVGTHMNVSGDLTSTAGNGGPASADLTVDDDLPSFSKSFAPSTVEFGGRSTLTFIIDNTASESKVFNLNFTDQLPPGMVIAGPANASTTCISGLLDTTLTATAGASVITLDANGFSPTYPVVAAGSTCLVTVDVVGGAVGSLGNVAGDLLFDFEPHGKAAATLVVTGFGTPLQLTKEFTNDPVAPGGTVELRFKVTNKSRDDAATGIAFDDDLEATLTGLAPAPSEVLPKAACGGSVDFAAGTLSFTGGSLGAEASCTFTVSLKVLAGSVPGTYPNTAGPVTGTIDGSPETGNVAGDLLFVVDFPVLTKEFTDDPVGAGGTVTLEFTITNPSTSAMSDVAFIDELTDGSGGSPPDTTSGFLPFPVTVGLPPTPNPPCGGGSSLTLVTVDTDRQGLSLTGGSLAANDGGPGGADTCTFSVVVAIPAGLPSGTYTNTTEKPSATLDDVAGTPTVVGPPASGDIVVVGAPQLTKEFTDDPAAPGDTVKVKFTLSHDAFASGAATAIAFTDDLTTLAPAVPGLTAVSVFSNTCAGSGVSFIPTSLIDFSGGTLTPGEECELIVTLSVPGGAASGLKTNTTSALTATVAGVTASSAKASDELLITGLLFAKEFTNDPTIAGGTVTLKFTLDNTTGTTDATDIAFTDVLDPDVLAGMAATGLPFAPCGGTVSTPDAGKTIVFSGGSVLASTSCDFDVIVSVPAGALDGSYLNSTSSLSATIGSAVVLPAAADALTVDSSLLALDKEFTNDPVVPGGTVTLKFTLTNLSATDPVTDIAFSDDLDAALSGLEATAASLNTCGGMATSGFPTGLFAYAGGSLAANDGMPGGPDTCMIVLAVKVPDAPLASAPPYLNTTSAVTGKVGALDVQGDPASDVLKVQLLTFAKDFTDDPVLPGDPVTLEFTLTNLGASAVSGLAFSDDLNAVISGLAATLPPTPDPPCGLGSAVAGSTFLAFTGGSLAAAGSAGDSCTFAVTVTVPSAAPGGTFPNTTSSLFQSGVSLADPAVANLEVLAPGTIIVEKQTLPDGALDLFTFTGDAAGSIGDGGQIVVSGLAPGTYTSTETLLAGWDLSSIVCDDVNSTGNTGTRTATFKVEAGETVKCTFTNLMPTLCFMGPTATGAGDALICANTNGGRACGFSEVELIALEGDPLSPPTGSAPSGIDFPFGLVAFTIDACTPGFTADLTFTLPSAPPPGTEYWKYGPTMANPTAHWYVYPATIVGNVISFSVTDGGDGDNDEAEDGAIVDPSGPGAPQQSVLEIPTLGPGLLGLMAALLALGAVAVLRRRLG